MGEEASTFFKTISNNKQVLLTFEDLEDEQLEAVNEDGSLNEEMVNLNYIRWITYERSMNHEYSNFKHCVDGCCACIDSFL